MSPKVTVRLSTVQQHLGPKADYLLTFTTTRIPRERPHLTGPDDVDRLYSNYINET